MRPAYWDVVPEPGGCSLALHLGTTPPRRDGRSTTIYNFYSAPALENNIVIMQIIGAIIGPIVLPSVAGERQRDTEMPPHRQLADVHTSS